MKRVRDFDYEREGVRFKDGIGSGQVAKERGVEAVEWALVKVNSLKSVNENLTTAAKKRTAAWWLAVMTASVTHNRRAKRSGFSG